MKSYIQDLCGDEDTVVIDCAILKCRMQDVIFEKLVNAPTNTIRMEDVDGAIWNVIRPYITPPSMVIDLSLKRGVNNEGKTICWNAE